MRLNAWLSPGGVVFHVEHGQHARFAEMWLKKHEEYCPWPSHHFDEELCGLGWKILSQNENGPLYVLPDRNKRMTEYQRIQLDLLLEEYGIEMKDVG